MGIAEESSKPTWGTVRHTSSSNPLINGKLMIVFGIILFVVVTMILCFYTIAKWSYNRQNRRYRRRLQAHLRSIAASRDPSLVSSLSPLDPTVLEKIPIFVYSSSESPPLEECSVCLSEFEDDDEGRLLPKCGHSFHVECIDTWFRSRSTCPLCRAPVQPETFSTRPESDDPVIVPVKPVEDVETGSSSSSSSSSPERFPMEACEREPFDLVGVMVENLKDSTRVYTG